MRRVLLALALLLAPAGALADSFAVPDVPAETPWRPTTDATLTLTKQSHQLGINLSNSNTWTVNQTIGAGAGQRQLLVNGGNSGSNGGSCTLYQAGGTTVNRVGGYSCTVGGAYSDDLTLYANDNLRFMSGGSLVGDYGVTNASEWTFAGASIVLGSNALTLNGALSTPAVAQGDLWYGSATGVISALAKTASTHRWISNTGTSNNPAWAQPACADLSNAGTSCTVNTGTSGATIPLLNGANTWSGVQTITNSDLALLGSSTGATTFTSANASATNYTATVPANTGTLAELNLAQTWSAAQSFNQNELLLNGTSGAITLNAAATAGTHTITLPAGTTDFSSTGGASQVVKQTSSGGAFTVAQLACADLSNSAASCSTDATNMGNAASGTLAIARGGTNDTGTAWSNYTPTVTCGSGSVNASYTIQIGRYKTLGKTVWMNAVVESSAVSTCSGSITISLPVTASNAAPGGSNQFAMLAGRDASVVNQTLIATIIPNSSGASAINATGGNPGGADLMVISGVYESN